MQVPRIFYAQCLSLSDTDGSPPRWSGMAGLRHKERHKTEVSIIFQGVPRGGRNQQIGCGRLIKNLQKKGDAAQGRGIGGD